MRIYPSYTQDAEFQALGALGFVGNLNDRQFAYLGDRGFPGGSLTDRFGQRSSPYAANDYYPSLVASFEKSFYGNGLTFDDLFTHSRASAAWQYNGTAWEEVASGVARTGHVSPTSGRMGALFEPAATQLLHTTNALVTQAHTVTAVAHTLHFTGTGTVTLSGASTAGPLVGTGTGEANRVSLTFTPSAGSLTLTVTGTVTDAQLETGSKPTSYIPNLVGSGTVARAADVIYVPAANIPAYTTALSMALEGEITYADNGVTAEATPIKWTDDASNQIVWYLDTAGGRTGAIQFRQYESGVVDLVISGDTAYSPGVNVPISIASWHTSTGINGAVDGVALTENSTPTALADLSSADLYLAYSGGPMLLFNFRFWADKIGNTGIAEAS